MNKQIFTRKTKTGYLATYNGVKGKGKTEIQAIERAVANEKKRNFKQDFTSENQSRSLASQN